MGNFRRPKRTTSRHKTRKAPSKRSNEQAIILSGLNVLQVLEDNAPKYLLHVLHDGPETFVGDDWAAALIWYRRKGYQNHKTLTLFGTWVIKEGEASVVHIDQKVLHYSAPIYNAESYNTLIKRDFRPYYEDDGSPPKDRSIHYQVTFDVTRRLALRRELADKLMYWLEKIR